MEFWRSLLLLGLLETLASREGVGELIQGIAIVGGGENVGGHVLLLDISESSISVG